MGRNWEDQDNVDGPIKTGSLNYCEMEGSKQAIAAMTVKYAGRDVNKQGDWQDTRRLGRPSDQGKEWVVERITRSSYGYQQHECRASLLYGAPNPLYL